MVGLDFGAKGPEFKSRPGGPGINVRRSYISDVIMKGCTVCRVAMQLSSLVCQYQPFTAIFSATDVAGFLLP